MVISKIRNWPRYANCQRDIDEREREREREGAKDETRFSLLRFISDYFILGKEFIAASMEQLHQRIHCPFLHYSSLSLSLSSDNTRCIIREGSPIARVTDQ